MWRHFIYILVVPNVYLLSNAFSGPLYKIPYPVIPPYDPEGNVDPLARFKPNLKSYLRQQFSVAYHEPRCSRYKDRPLIEPVYYWPGDTIKLECRLCERGELLSGHIKYWTFLHRNIAAKIRNLRLTLRDKEWKYVDVFNSRIDDIAAPDWADSHRPERPIPPIKVYQQNGYLVIQNSRIANYGLYRCFDQHHEDQLGKIYYLIPYTPLLLSTKNDIRDRCSITSSIRQFDGLHRWRLPPTFIQDKKNGICAGECNEEYLDTSKIQTPIAKWNVQHIDAGAMKKLTEQLNLEVYLHWDDWTECDQTKMQTRSGQCYIRKTDNSIIFNEKNIDNLGSVYYAARIHRFLEKIPAFKTRGIPMFSGILMDSVVPRDQILGHCSKIPGIEWNSFAGLLTAILSQGISGKGPHGEIQLSPCLREIKHKSQKKSILSHTVFQTSKCK